MFACLMFLFVDRSIKYVEAFSMQCLIIILVICYSRECQGSELIYTNLSHEFLLSFVWMKFLRFRRSHDIRGIKETQELKLGDAQGIPNYYFKKSQASKLGDAPVGIPPFFFNNYQLVSVEPKFLLLHMMSAILEMSFYFVLLAV